MQTVMDKLAQLSAFLIMLGAGSFALHFFDMEFRLLAWIDQWGTGTGNMIRIAFIVVGIIGLVLGSRFGSDDDDDE